jgi:hypothetical protein
MVRVKTKEESEGAHRLLPFAANFHFQTSAGTLQGYSRQKRR